MKKGFTIIELITVVVLLSLIAVFTFPTVNTTIKNRREALYDIQVDNIKASAISYIDKNGLLKNNDKVIVTLCQLKQNGYSDEKLKNPINGKYIPDDSKVIVTKDDRIFIYGTEDNVSCTITDSTLFEYVEVGSSYKETIDLSKYTIKIYKDNNVVDRIDTSLIGSYFMEYENSNSKIYKYLYIVDTTPPDIKYKDKVNNSYVIGDSIVTLEASQGVFNSYDVVVNDNSGEIITPIVSTNVNLRVPGSYFLTYNATDASLNKVTKTQTIKVVDTFAPTINNVLGNPTSPTSMSAIISVDAFDNGTGLHPLGAYSFDGGNTWQTENSVTVDNNTTLKIVVRDAAGNKSSKNVVINKIVRDDRNISFSINKGTIKNNGWFIDNVDVLVKPLVSEEFFESFSYCTGESVCEPNIVSNKYNGEVVSLTSNTDGVLVCGKVNKKDGTSTDTLCSIEIKIDKGIPSVYYNVLDGKMNSGFEPWYVSNVDLEVKSQSSSGIEKIEYCTTTGSSCSPNKVINGSSPRLTISNNSKTNKVCSIVTNGAGNRSQNTCSINYQIDKTVPSVSISVSGNVDDYIGQNASLTAVVDPTTTVSGYTYYWYKNDTLIQSGSNNTIRINNGPDIYRIDNYKVVVITGAGNQGSSTKTLKVDTIKPTCVLNASGTVGNDGWYISSSVNVTGTFKDSESGILSKGIGTSLGYNDNTTYSVKTNTKGTTVYCSVKDKVGNEGTNSIVIKKDDGSDTVCTASSGNSNWTNQTVAVTYRASNSYSGFKYPSGTSLNSIISNGNSLSIDLISDHDGYEYAVRATAYGGREFVQESVSYNSWSVELKSGAKVTCSGKTINMYYDGVAPTCSYTENSSWTNKNVTIKNSCNDSGSGCESTSSFSKTFSGSITQKTFNNSSTIKDKAGNETTCNHNYNVYYDGEAPSCSYTENSNWTKNNVTIKSNCTDSGSGCTSTSGFSKTFSGSITQKTYDHSYTVSDAVGNTNTCKHTYNVYYDGEAPSCSYTENSSWTNKNVTIKNNCNDSGSGCESASTFSKTFSGSITQKTFNNSSTIKDKVGNETTCSHNYNVYYDGEAPTCSYTENSSWTNNNVTIKNSCNDSGSGCESTSSFSKTFSGSITQKTFNDSSTIKDKAGNTTTCSYNYNVYYDGEAPSCSYTENSNWTKNNVTIKSNCTDSGSGCTSTSGFSKTFSGSITQKTYDHSYTVSDAVGNTNTCKHTYNVYYDGEAPSCSYTENSSWTNKNVTIKNSCNDSGSGCESASTFSKTFSGSITQKTFNNSSTIKDKAGNETTCSHNYNVYYDGEAPSCSYTENSSWTNNNVTIKNSCNDSGSGCESTSSFSKTFSGSITQKTFNDSSTIKDKSGNTTTCNHNYNVYYDGEAPSCSYTENSNWTKNNVTIKSNCTDSGSGCTSTSGFSKIFSGSITQKTYDHSYTVSDAVGNTNTCKHTYNVYYDGEAPSCSYTENSSWSNKNVTIKNSCSDSGSGCESASTFSKTFSGSITQKTFNNSSTIKDKAGNETTCSHNYNVYYDGEAPSCSYTENSSWTNNNVTIKNSCIDSGSGCESTSSFSKTFSGSITQKTFNDSSTIKDKAGNETTCNHNYNVYYDGEAPTCSFSGNNPNGNNGWYKSNATISATFNDSGSGVLSKGVSLNKNDYNSNESYSLTQNTSGTTLYCSVKDKAGNVGSNSLTVKKDDGSGASCVLRGENSNWTNSMVSVSYVANSNLSKFASSQNISSSNVSGYAEGGFTGNDSRTEVGLYARYYGTISYKSVSFKGFTAVLESGASVYCDSKDANVYYDGVAPKCSYNENSNWTNKTVTIGNTCSDSASGCAEGVGLNRNINGSSTVKTIKLDNTITDKAGNTTTCSHTYDVYYDPVPPKCNYNENSSWTNKMVTIGNSCSDSDSGCSDNTSWNKSFSGAIVQKTFTNANIISDKAGNTTTCDYTYDVYYDGEAPKCTINVRSTGQYGIFGEVTASDDSGSGLSDSVSQSFANLKYTTNYSFSDNAGNAGSCEVKVDSYNQEQKRTRTYQSCQNASCGWGDWEITTAFGNVCTTDSRPLYDACEFECRGIKLWQRCLKTCSTAECGYNSYGSWTNVSSCSSDDLTECRTVKIYYNPS